MIKCRHSHLFLSFIAYLTILVADDRLFTANCCFKLVFVATKVAHRAMTDMLSKGREKERLMMKMRVSGKFDKTLSRENSEREREREKEETHTNESRTRSQRLSGDVKRKKDARRDGKNQHNLYYACVFLCARACVCVCVLILTVDKFSPENFVCTSSFA